MRLSPATSLLSISILLSLLAIGLTERYLTSTRQDMLSLAQSHNTVLVQSLEEHAKGLLDAAEQQLRDFAADISIHPNHLSVAARPQRHPLRPWPVLAVGASGEVVFRSSPLGPQNFAETAYFNALRQGAERSTGRWDTESSSLNASHFAVAHPLYDLEGVFVGAVIVVVPTATFLEFYEHLALADTDNINVLGATGVSLIRRTDRERTRPEGLALLMKQGVESGSASGFYTLPSVDGNDYRLGVLRRIQGWPLAVSISSSLKTVLAPWRLDAVLMAGLLCLLLGTIAGLTLLGWRKIQAENVAAQRTLALLDELHHRVRNNFAMINMVLMLDSRWVPEFARRNYQASMARIHVLSLVHRLLDERGDFATINGAALLALLAQEALGDRLNRQITHHHHGEGLIPADRAMSLGLIAFEALDNAARHGLPLGCSGSIVTRLVVAADHIHLEISDSGGGFPADLLAGKGRNAGLSLIGALGKGLRLQNQDGAHLSVSV